MIGQEVQHLLKRIYSGVIKVVKLEFTTIAALDNPLSCLAFHIIGSFANTALRPLWITRGINLDTRVDASCTYLLRAYEHWHMFESPW